jgi:SAM-dependent methyltransferase
MRSHAFLVSSIVGQREVMVDTYEGFAERYDWMKQENPVRQEFFRQLFARHNVARVLDCACGTGRDLIMLHWMGFQASGSDLSDAMLTEARKNLAQAQADIPIQKVDYRDLPSHWDTEFDAVVCLTNSINEPLKDNETLHALRSMKSVLRPDGILVFDQGQSDASMRNPPRFAPVLNNRDFTRFFVIEYSGDIQTVHIFDFIHTQEASDFQHVTVRIRIRLRDSWNEILGEAGFAEVEFFGDWDSTPYDREVSRILIAVAKK